MQQDIYPKADVLHRVIAKCIDLLIFAAFYELLPRIGFMAGLFYLLISDGFPGGRGVGKWLIGLQTFVPAKQSICSFRESVIRNFPLAIGCGLFLIPYVGWAFTAGILAVEALLTIGNERGMRMGDELAGTQVLESEMLDVGVER